MSFIRPEVRATLWRWREVGLCIVVILFAVRLLGQGLERSAPLQTGFALLVAALFSVLLFYAVLRARLFQSAEGTGVVVVSEREIAYLGPDTGAFVSLDDLTRLEIMVFERTNAAPDIFWTLSHTGGDPLMIPLNAKGAETLFDTFAALPGVRLEDATRAVARAHTDRVVIWQKTRESVSN